MVKTRAKKNINKDAVSGRSGAESREFSDCGVCSQRTKGEAAAPPPEDWGGTGVDERVHSLLS